MNTYQHTNAVPCLIARHAPRSSVVLGCGAQAHGMLATDQRAGAVMAAAARADRPRKGEGQKPGREVARTSAKKK